MLVESGRPRELAGVAGAIDLFHAGDVLVLNETRVLRRRVFAESGLEILFLKPQSSNDWEVLCPSSRWKPDTEQVLPGGRRLRLKERGRVQVVTVNEPLTPDYFETHGDLPLPPYIQKARGERRNRQDDQSDYQTAWAKQDGSLAAPTASLHFSTDDLAKLEAKGVRIVKIVLHVGLGTFLPITAENLGDHQMHSEWIEVSNEAWETVQNARRSGAKVWALGTTVVRSLESVAHAFIQNGPSGFFGESNLFIKPGFEFRAVDRILTNFHQPKSTLLALVGAFAGLDTVKAAYAWAIERDFRLFSYGDLTIWKP